MCRLLGIASNETTDFKIVLREAPRSLAALSREHRDGWGIAVFDAQSRKWQIDKGAACAGEDERFHRLAVGSRGELLVSHVRQKTIGETSLANTHPFERGRWVFAHNGTVKDVVFDLAQLKFISSAGLRVFTSTRKVLKERGGQASFINLQPQIQEVFEIMKSLPGVAIFKDVAELDRYLAARQRSHTENE